MATKRANEFPIGLRYPHYLPVTSSQRGKSQARPVLQDIALVIQLLRFATAGLTFPCWRQNSSKILRIVTPTVPRIDSEALSPDGATWPAISAAQQRSNARSFFCNGSEKHRAGPDGDDDQFRTED